MNKELQKSRGRNFKLTPYGEISETSKQLLGYAPAKPKRPEYYHPFGNDNKNLMVIIGGSFLPQASSP